MHGTGYFTLYVIVYYTIIHVEYALQIFTDLYRNIDTAYSMYAGLIYTLYCGLFQPDPNSQFLAQHQVPLQINIKKTIYGIASLRVAIIRDPNRRMIVSTCINKSSK